MLPIARLIRLFIHVFERDSLVSPLPLLIGGVIIALVVSQLGSEDTLTEQRLPRLGEHDPYGARTIPETEHLFTRRRLQRWAQGHKKHFHRVKNGVNDPVTFYHVVQEILGIRPNEWFTAKALVDYLNYAKPMLVWDSVTVGRVLNDIYDTFVEVNGDERLPLQRKRYSSGAHYALTPFPEARAALVNLLDDLDEASEKFVAAETNDAMPQRLTSPLAGCPSLLAGTVRVA
jgi:hypothetical protein